MRKALTGAPGAAALLTAFVALSFAHDPAAAQAQRDPTQPPAAAVGQSASAPRPASSVGVDLLEKSGYSIIVREGKPFLVVGTRLYAQGEKLGAAVIERISETEVWLKEGRELRKVSQFSGIQRRVVSAGAGAPACAASAPKASARARIPANNSSTKSPRMTSCVDDQP